MKGQTSTSEQVLTSLAVLTVNWNRGHDTIDSFVPIVADCVKQSVALGPISTVDLQAAIKAEFGLKIPVGALQVILGRCAKRGYVRRQHNVYVPVVEKLDSAGFAATRREALREHSTLLGKLRRFAEERYQLVWSEEEADTALLGYLQEGSLPILAAADGEPLPKPSRQSRRTRHVVAAFVAHLDEADTEGFGCLETVAKGYILSSVLFYPDLGRVESHFEELDVLCDTPFLLRAIGYNEDGYRIQCVELLELLRELGANLKCFHHTREEVAGVLEMQARRLRSGNGQGEASPYYTTKAMTFTEVEEMIIGLNETLRALGIEVVDTPEWTMKPDELALEEAISKKINYLRERAREKDVASLAAIARLRNLRRMDTFEKAKAIFVTTNTTLARASSQYFKDIESRGGIPLCMPVELMTRLAWVKKPLAKPELPRNLVIASAYAALNPPPALWHEYQREIARRREQGTVSEAEYYFLRSSREAREALMDETFGDEAAFTTGTVDELLAHAKASIQAEADERAREALEGQIAAENRAVAEQTRREWVENVHHDVVDRRARRIGLAVGWAAAAVLGVAFVLGVLASIPEVPLVGVRSWWHIPIWVCVGLATVALAAGGIGIRKANILDLRAALSRRIERWWSARGHHKLDELHAGGPPQISPPAA